MAACSSASDEPGTSVVRTAEISKAGEFAPKTPCDYDGQGCAGVLGDIEVSGVCIDSICHVNFLECFLSGDCHLELPPCGDMLACLGGGHPGAGPELASWFWDSACVQERDWAPLVFDEDGGCEPVEEPYYSECDGEPETCGAPCEGEFGRIIEGVCDSNGICRTDYYAAIHCG